MSARVIFFVAFDLLLQFEVNQGITNMKYKHSKISIKEKNHCVLPTLFLFQVADLANEDTPQLYIACGRGPRSTLRVLRHGLEVSEMAVSELPGNPNAVWTVKRRVDG